MANIATLKDMTRMMLLAGLMCGVVGFVHAQASAGAGGAPSAAGAGVASGGAAGGGAAGAGVAAGAAAAGRVGGGEGRGGTSSSVPGLGGAASDPRGAAPPSKKGPPSISGSNASGRSAGMGGNRINATRRCGRLRLRERSFFARVYCP